MSNKEHTGTLWRWFIRNRCEIFVDLDGKTEKNYRAKLLMVRRRLEGSIAKGTLPAKGVFFYPSLTPLHHHLIVICERSLLPLEAQAWALYLGSDIFRAANNLMRLADPVTSRSADLLISADGDRYRMPDFYCTCPDKHTPEIMEKCPVALHLRGEYVDYFGKPLDNKTVWNKFGKIFQKGDSL